MSRFRSPVGQQPPKVYWRRRVVVGIGVLVVIIVIIVIATRLGSPSPAATGKVASANSASPKASVAPSTPAAEVGGAACAPSRLKLEAVADKTSYGAEEKPMISMKITNTGTTDCSINLGSSQQELIITSGTEKIWDSKDCQVTPADQPTTLKPGAPMSTSAIPWDRTRSSSSTCSASRPPVTAGGASYHLAVKMGAIASKDSAQFLLN